jgi:nucleoside diphosphate kinase
MIVAEGFLLVRSRLVHLSRESAQQFYAEHRLQQSVPDPFRQKFQRDLKNVPSRHSENIKRKEGRRLLNEKEGCGSGSICKQSGNQIGWSMLAGLTIVSYL